MIRVATYTRVSTLEQAEEGYSIQEQQDKLEKFCEVKDWTITKRYSDPGFSGANIHRPGITKLIEDAKNKAFDLVVVYKLDRLSRSQKDTLYIIEDVLQAKNIGFVSLSENFDTSTPFGKAMVGILSVFAQLEREQIKERMTMGKVGRAKAGKAMSWANVPFGYTIKNDVYEIDEFQASIVRDIYKKYLAGTGPAGIAADLNRKGFLGKTTKWSHRTVRAILDNIVYTGFMNYKGKIYPGLHKPIISMDDYNEVQRQIKIRAVKNSVNSRPFRSKYMLSGLLKCHYCGCTLQVNISIVKNGEYVKRYNCPSAKPRKNNTYKHVIGCPLEFKYMLDLENEILTQVEQLPKNIKTVQKKTVDTESIKNEIAKLKIKQSKLMDLYLIDNIDISEIDKRNKEITNQIKALEKQLVEVPEEVDLTEAIKKTKKIRELSYKEQRNLVRQLIEKIVVSNDDLKIFWRF